MRLVVEVTRDHDHSRIENSTNGHSRRQDLRLIIELGCDHDQFCRKRRRPHELGQPAGRDHIDTRRGVAPQALRERAALPFDDRDANDAHTTTLMPPSTKST